MAREQIDPALRAQLLERLSHRSARLAKMAAISAPDAVINMMAQHVAVTAMVLLGEEFGRELFSRAMDDLSESYGICRFCRARPLRQDRTMCQVCWDQTQSDDDITDDEIIAMGLADGTEEPASTNAVDPADGIVTG